MTRLAFNRPISSYVKVRRFVGGLRRNKPGQITRDLIAQRPYLNVGCGHNIAPGFINLDYEWQPGVDLCWDINNPLPIPDASLRGIFTEHCLEHVPRETTVAALAEFKRCLAPGGTVRVVLPDAGLFARLYVAAEGGETVAFPLQEPFDGWTPMAELNRVMRSYEHLYGYDATTLTAMLQQAGFQEARQVSFGQGRDPHLLIDTSIRESESFYVEAVA